MTEYTKQDRLDMVNKMHERGTITSLHKKSLIKRYWLEQV